ncbi:GA module-containing protein [Mycoplasmopsis verecunda]|uniref:DNA repair exonuclease SbcCD ATPase subunit n=1 Tax=Mycoplasmopsis verecunda TaxID=171291 RepID=A0A1T4KXV7_9BACT|nr:GA module-containing protein [Mycoplasmopsis verecunda]WPB54341.1 GA module-containing protein [Mycoplasmopsis verecunda]SJZ47295.1 DNA repair exonuclease SbcCD ATPase subunit [Mycoplasmopsis verecunda]
MSKNSRSNKTRKTLVTVAALSGSVLLPLTTLSNADNVLTEENMEVFLPNKIIDVNQYQNRKEYENIENVNFGYAKYVDVTMNKQNAERLVKFTKVPTEEQWNAGKQTWELIYESGTLDNNYYDLGHFWKNEYPFGQRTYGFALSNDLELIPGTLSIKMEYMGVEDNDHIVKNEADRRRVMSYSITGDNPNTKNDPSITDNGIQPQDQPTYLWDKYGTYIRFVDNNGYFDNSADQDFNSPNAKYNDINSFWVRSVKFDMENGRHRKGNWMYDWNHVDSEGNKGLEPWKLNIIPEYENLSDYRPAINGIEYITTDVRNKNSYDGVLSPNKIDILLSLTQSPDEKKQYGYARYFGIGLDTDKYHNELKSHNADTNNFKANTGTLFLFHYETALDKNRYDTNKRPIPMVTIKFQTRKKYSNAITRLDDDNDIEANTFVDNRINYNSFVSGLYHSDKDIIRDWPWTDNRWAFNKTIANTGLSFDEFRNKYLTPSYLGVTRNQYTGAAISYASRTKDRQININLTEKMEQYNDQYHDYPEITGFNIYQNGKLIDKFNIPWDITKNSLNFKTNGYRTQFNNFKIDTTKLNGFDGITLEPITKTQEGSFKFDTKSNIFEWNPFDGTFSGTISYHISQEYKNKEALLAKLEKNPLESELLYKNEPLLDTQLIKIKSTIKQDFWRKRFDGKTVLNVETPETSLYTNYWTDFVKNISKLNYDKKAFDKIDLNVLNTVNYRLSDNKEQIDLVVPRIKETMKKDFTILKMGINENDGEIIFDTPNDNPRMAHYDRLLERFNTLVAQMNGEQVYNKLVNDIDSELSIFKKKNQLYQLAKYLNNNANSEIEINNLNTVLSNFELLKKYLKDTVTTETLDEFKNAYQEYLNNVPKYTILEKLVTTLGDESNPEFIKLSKWFGYKDSYDAKVMTPEKAKEFKNNILDNYNINHLVDEILSSKNTTENIKNLKNAVYFIKSFDEFNNMPHWYDLNGTELPALQNSSFKYELSEDARSYLATESKTLAKYEDNGFKSNIYNFIKNKNRVNKELSEKLNQVLGQNGFKLNDVLKSFISKNFPNALSDDEINRYLSPILNLNLAPTFENLGLIQDAGLADALYSYLINALLAKINKYAITSEAILQAGNNLRFSKLEALAQGLTSINKKNGFTTGNLIDNNNYDEFLNSIIKSKIAFKETYSPLKEILETSKGEKNAKLDDLKIMFDSSFYHSIFKSLVVELKEKVKSLNNIQNQALKNDFVSNIEKTIARYDFTEERLSNNKFPTFWESDEKVKSDWDTYGNFFTWNEALTPENYAKITKDLISSPKANVDQYYYDEYQKLVELNDAIGKFKEKVDKTTLSNTLKDSLKTLAGNATSKQFVNDLSNKLDDVVLTYDTMNTNITKAEGLKVKSSNNIPYRFASDEIKNKFNSKLEELKTAKSNLDNMQITATSQLDTFIESSKQLSSDITDSISKLDGQKNLIDLLNKVDQANLTIYTQEQKEQLKNNLKNKDDLASAKAAELSFEELGKLQKQASVYNNIIQSPRNIKSNQKYLDADEKLRTAYDASEVKVVNIATKLGETLSELAKNDNSEGKISWPDKIAELNAQYAKDIDKYKEDFKALNGDTKLVKLKEELTNKVRTQFNNVSDQIKQSYIDDIENTNSIKEANETFETKKDIDTEFGTARTKLNELNDLIANTAKDNKFHALDNDSNKQNVLDAQTNAKAKFNNDNKAIENVDIAKAKELTKSITDAIKTINDKYQKLLDNKAQKAKEIANLPHLNQNQKTKLAEEINNKDTYNNELLNAVVTKANDLDGKMALLEKEFTNASKAKSSNNYIYATSEPKNKFDELFGNNATYLTNANNATTPGEVEALVNNAKQVISSLDGDAEFAKLQKTAKDSIDQLKQITPEQKQHFKDLVQSATTKDAIDRITKLAKTLDDKIKDLNETLTNANNTKSTVKYTQADLDKQEEFNTAITNLINELDKLKQNNEIVASNLTEALKDVNEASQALSTANNALNGELNLSNAKSEANGAIEVLNNLNDQVKDNLKQQVANANTVSDVNAIKQKAIKTDTKAGELIAKVTEANAYEKNVDVIAISTEQQKQALSNAINDVKNNILDSSNKMKPNEFADQLEAKKQAIDNAMQTIANQISEVKKAREQAINTINSSLTNLTDVQKNELATEVNNANTIQDINKVSSKATTLNTATGEFNTAKTNAEKVQKTDNAYALADKNKQEAFDKVIQEAKVAYEAKLSHKTAEEIQKLTKDLNDGKNNLNGDNNLQALKDQVIKAINENEKLSAKQKENIANSIQTSNKADDINSLKQAAKSLNDALSEAEKILTDNNAEKVKPNYLEADNEKKQDFNSKDTLLNSKVESIKQDDVFDSLDEINKYVSELADQGNKAKEARTNLNGQDLLDKAKAKGTGTIEALEHLSQPYKQNFENQVTNKTTINDVNEVVTNANELNQATKTLKDNIAKLEGKTTEPSYEGISAPTKEKVNNALSDAKKLLTDNLLNDSVSKEDITQANQKISRALEAIKSDALDLETLRTKKAADIDTMDNLSRTQKDALKGQVNKAATKEEIHDIMNTANNLSDAMKKLADAITSVQDIKSKPQYTQASVDKKAALDTVASDKKLEELAKDKQSSLDASDILAKANTITTPLEQLDGDANVAKAKEKANTTIYSKLHLDNEQKKALSNEANGKNTISEINEVVKKATDLDDAIKALKASADKINKDNNTEPAKYNYLNASEEKQQALDKELENSTQAIQDAKAITSTDKVDEMFKKLQEAKKALDEANNNLDGNGNLAKAKEQANSNIEQLQNLSDQHKTADKNDINSTNLVTDVNNKVQKVSELDKGTNDLVEQLIKATELNSSDNVNKVSQDNKNALVSAITNANNVLDNNKLKAGDTTAQDLNTLKEALQRAITNANNDIKVVSQAAQNAKDAIDKLTNLTQKQKDALKTEVDAKTNKADIKSVVEKAKTLDETTKKLNEAIKTTEELNKQDVAYKEADKDKQDQFNNALDEAKKAKDDNYANKTSDELNKLLSNLNNAKDGLNGAKNFETAQNNAKADIEQLNNLSKEQKDKLKDKINNASDSAKAKEIASKASALDKAIKNAQDTKDKHDKVLNTPAYSQADDKLKENLDNNEKLLEQDLAKAKELNDFDNNENLDKVIKDLTNKTTEVNNNIKALNGDSNLTKAISNATDEINKLENLSDELKEQLNEKVNNAKTIADANDIVSVAKELDKVVKNLNEAIKALDDVNKFEAKDSISAELKDAITNELAKANKLLDNSKLKANNDNNSVTNATKALKDILEKVNKELEALTKTKEDAKDEIGKLAHLSDLQKGKLNEDITKAKNSKEIQDIITKANELDKAMETLQNKVNELAKVKDSKNYKLADANNQDLINNLTTDQVLPTLQKDAITSTNVNDINDLISNINKANEKLNGNNNLTKALENVDKLHNLNEKQIAKAKEELNKQNTKEDLDAKLENIVALNTNIGSLKNKIQDLDNLITRFSKPDNISLDQLAQYNYLINKLVKDKDALVEQKTTITNALNTDSLSNDDIETYITNVDKLITSVNAEIQAVKAVGNDAITYANKDNMFNDDNKYNVANMSEKLSEANINLYKALKDARLIEQLKAKDEYNKFNTQLSNELKESKAFALALDGAAEELNASTSRTQDAQVLDKINHQVLKENLVLAYDKANDLRNDEFWSKEATPILDHALEIIKYPNTNMQNTKEFYDNEAAKLNWFNKARELKDTIDIANNSKDKSEDLVSLLNEASKAIKTPNTTTIDKLNELNDKLKHLAAKDILVKAIQEATILNEELKEAQKVKDSKTRENVIGKLNKAINDAKNIAKLDDQPSKVYNRQASDLNNALADSKKALAEPKEKLQKAITKAQEIKDKSNNLANQEAKAIEMNQNIDNVDLADVEKQVVDLNKAIKTNDLEIAIAKAPEIKTGEYDSVIVPETPNSIALVNKPDVTENEIKSQADKQLLNNAQINAINNVYNLTDLNKEQKDKYVSDVAKAKTPKDVEALSNNVSELNKGMKALKNTYNNIPNELKEVPVVSYDYLLSSEEEKASLDKAISEAKGIIPQNGTVYKNNNASEVNDLNKALQQAYDNLSGRDKSQKVASDIKDDKDSLNKSIQNVNANKLFNAPKALQDKYNNNKKIAEELLDLYNSNPVEFINKGGISQVNKAVENVSQASGEIDKFSDKEFKNINNERITQANDFVANNSEFIDKKASDKALEEFDKQVTYQGAIDKINNIQLANEAIKQGIQSAIKVLDAKMDNDTTKQNVSDLFAPFMSIVNKDKINPLLELDDSVNQLNVNKTQFNELLKQKATDKAFDNNIAHTVSKANNISNIVNNPYVELQSKANEKINAHKNNVNKFNDIITALKTNDKEKLHIASQGLGSEMQNDKAFAQALASKNLPEILDRNKKLTLTPDDLNVINNLKNSSEYQKASPALKSFIEQDFKVRNKLLWWPILVAISALAFITGLSTAVFKRNKNK